MPINDSKFIKRVVSSVVLAPVVLLCVYFGGIAFQIFVGVLLGLSIYEWWMMSLKSKYKILFGIFGSLYIGVCIGALYFLRQNESGDIIILSLLLMVWAGDTGAYFAGKFIGGPKMAPRLSPNKTWAGLIGGMVAGGAIFHLCAIYLFNDISYFYFIFGALMGIVGQIGDVSISAMKRYVKVKDTGRFIPGHGGILDRIDALLPVAFCLFLTHQSMMFLIE